MRHRDAPKLIYMVNPKSPHAEAYRTLRTNIQYATAGGKKEYRSLIVTSAEPAEGKTTTISNLALALAHAGKKTLLIDADLRKSSIHHVFRLANTNGLTDVLIGEEEPEACIEPVTDYPLYVLTAGRRVANPAEELASSRMHSLIKRWQEEYDIVLLDTPPVLPVTDAQLLSSQVDAVILVLRSGHIHRQKAIKAKQLLEHVSANLIGTVLNQKQRSHLNDTYYYGDDG
ncbi:CpsD/CapB family tyrosine-protein kinase [Brevibacillus humidisoli]|uniref:CpsD/CapB family tyrosine-protein kinase n=1 Tax=Brevibacillus humidisoli TaxID=2895522 RepID=UPI001E5651ED|nr:CpsD/CapB family tyrosine-protein kinase [Brevibacillus humidisoli]UFJ42499.1 CpsD/CapB family tyrosine-protein kinase [Brevibacillus humidisoli]